jgi:hypothetical protein
MQTHPGRFGRRYPWNAWFRKETFTLLPGRDYNGMPHTMAQQIRNNAKMRRLSVSISIDETGLIRVANYRQRSSNRRTR